MSDIVERLRNRALATAIIKGNPALYNDAADAIISLCAENEALHNQAEMNARLLTENASLRAENAKLRLAMHDIYEVYAGCDELLVETSRAYLEQLLKEMSDIAAEHKI